MASQSREVIMVDNEDPDWDPSDNLSPRQPLGKGVEVAYQSGISTVRIQGSPVAAHKTPRSSSSSSEPSTPPTPPITPNLPVGSLTPSQLSAATLSSIASNSSAALKSPATAQSPNNATSLSNAMDTPDSSTSSVSQTYKSGNLKSSLSERRKKAVDLDNISIVSDIPSEPGGTSLSGTIRGFQASLNPITEDNVEASKQEADNEPEQESNVEPNNNEPSQAEDKVRIEMRRFTAPAKKVSWNDSVIVTTTDSDNVMLAGLPYEGSDTSSTSSSRNSNGGLNSPLPSPTATETPPVLTNLHHRSASRIYNRKAPADPTPIVDEFELAQLGQMLGSKDTPPPTPYTRTHQALRQTSSIGTYNSSTGTLTSSIGTISHSDGPPYVTSTPSVVSSSQPELPEPTKSTASVHQACFIFAIVLIVLCVVALVALGILYAIRHKMDEDPLEVMSSMKSRLHLRETRSRDLWVQSWSSNTSLGQTKYLVPRNAMLPWQKPSKHCHLGWHRGSPIRVYVRNTMNTRAQLYNMIVGDPYTVETADVYMYMDPRNYYAAELLSQDDHYSLISIMADDVRWTDMKTQELAPDASGKPMTDDPTEQNKLMQKFMRRDPT